jgi:hypothetical protein
MTTIFKGPLPSSRIDLAFNRPNIELSGPPEVRRPEQAVVDSANNAQLALVANVTGDIPAR